MIIAAHKGTRVLFLSRCMCRIETWVRGLLQLLLLLLLLRLLSAPGLQTTPPRTMDVQSSMP